MSHSPPQRARASLASESPGENSLEEPLPSTGIDVHLDADGNPRMVERRFVVEEAFAGHRLDHYLKRKIPRLSRTKLQAIIRTQVKPIRGRAPKPCTSVAPGDEIVIRRPARPEPPCPRTFAVLHDDPCMMVIDKPAGLPVHASAKFYFNTLTRVLSERYPGRGVQICHRLDRETSGALVVAKSKQAAAGLKGSFARHRVRKAYLAVVHGQPPWPGRSPEATGGDLDLVVSEALEQTVAHPAAGAASHPRANGSPANHLPESHLPESHLPASHLPASHLIDLPLGLVQDPEALIPIRMVVRDDAQPARTRARVLARRDGCALILCVPITGRQHQIRAHLAASGYPIVGDKLYAHGDQAFAAFCDDGMTPELLARFELPRHALHAAAIAIPHPETGDWVRVLSPLPDDLRDYLSQRPPLPEPPAQGPGTC